MAPDYQARERALTMAHEDMAMGKVDPDGVIPRAREYFEFLTDAAPALGLSGTG